MGSLDETNPSLWVATTPAERRYPSLQGHAADLDVVVVGAGIAGLTVALTLVERGARVAVLEADALCSGTTGYTTAKVTSLHGLMYAGLLQRKGEQVARAYGAANEGGLAQIAEWVERVPASATRPSPMPASGPRPALRMVTSMTASRPSFR